MRTHCHYLWTDNSYVILDKVAVQRISSRAYIKRKVDLTPLAPGKSLLIN